MRQFKILQGSDPEFYFHNDKNRRVVANLFFGRGAGDRTALHSAIGHDGHRETAELRPKACFSALAMLLEIKSIILETVALSRELETLAWIAKPVVDDPSILEWQGGHIHFSFWGLNPNIQIFEPLRLNKLRCYRCGDGIISALINALDHCIDMPLLNIAYSGNKRKIDESDLRLRHMPERYRPKGIESHFEWRTPQTWLVHPKLAFIYLALSKAFVRTNVAKEISEGMTECYTNNWNKPAKCDHIKVSSGDFLGVINNYMYDRLFPEIYADKIRRALILEGEEKHIPGVILTLKDLDIPRLSDRDFKWNWITREEVERIRREWNIKL